MNWDGAGHVANATRQTAPMIHIAAIAETLGEIKVPTFGMMLSSSLRMLRLVLATALRRMCSCAVNARIDTYQMYLRFSAFNLKIQQCSLLQNRVPGPDLLKLPLQTDKTAHIYHKPIRVSLPRPS